MKIGLNATISDPQHDGLVDELAARGVTHVRTDIPMTAIGAELDAWVNYVGRPLAPLFLSCGGKMQHDGRAWTVREIVEQTLQIVAACTRMGLTDYGLEPQNELDIAHQDFSESPAHGAHLIREVYTAVRAAGFTGLIYGCGTANLNKRGLRYLEKLLASGNIPADIGIAVHWYPEASLDPHDAHDGYRSRDDEWLALKRLVGDRPIAVTEVGYHQSTHLTDDGVIAAYRFERNFWDTHGAEALYWYGINDAEPNTMENRFGIRRSDGSWKPVADNLRDSED